MRLILCLLFALTLWAEPKVVTDPAEAGLDPAKLARIPKRMQEFVNQGLGPGIVTLVARHGKIAALDAVGYFDRDTKQPIKTDNIFQIHSMTKPIVCIGIMMLLEEGKLALGDPVEKHLPEFRGLKVIDSKDGERLTLRPPSRLITIRDLMTHTSGMALNPPEGIKELHGQLHKTLTEAVLLFSQQPLLFDPGTKWSYSNTGIAALGRILEVHSGMPFEKFLEARIFQPLGMTDTYIYPPKEKFNRMPTAYLLKDGTPVKYTTDPLGEGAMKFREGARYPLPEGGVYSTAGDLFALYQMMLNKGAYNGAKLLSPASVEAMTRVYTAGIADPSPGMGWGLGWTVVRDPAAALTLSSAGTYGHGGRYGTYCFIDPHRDLIGIFMIHREGGGEERTAFQQMATTAAVD